MLFIIRVSQTYQWITFCYRTIRKEGTIKREFNMAAERIRGDNGAIENLRDLPTPERILLFSGKRKSGKDFITDVLHQRIGPERSIIIKLSGPIKTYWAKSLGLDINRLLGDGEYKETYRLEMAKWGENVRKQDYGYFCQAAIDMYNAYSKPIWIISDARRKTDIKWFLENFGDICKTIRIVSNDVIRVERGWVFTPGVDDSETECDLDDVNTWDLRVENNNEDIDCILGHIFQLIR